MDAAELELLLTLDGASFEMARGVLVEFTARRTDVTPERPHGISDALVLRDKSGGPPWLRFDNAHAMTETRHGHRRAPVAYDHWHRTAHDKGRSYAFTTAARLLEAFWREVKRTLDEKSIPHDL